MVRDARPALLLAGALLSGCAEPAPPPPSIVLFSVDTLGARHLSLYGYERPTSPFLDAWAEEAVVFEHCLANAPWTGPSYASQLTGLYPRSFRLEPTPEQPQPLAWVIPEERTTLAEHLAAAGYRTAAFVDNPLLTADAGFDQGFELFDTTAADRPLDDPGGGVHAVVPRVLSWLEDLPDGAPFFVFVNVLDVHGPYHPAPPFAGRFSGDGRARSERTLPVARDHGDIHGAVPLYIAAGVEGAAEARELRAAPIEAKYDEQVLSVDAAFGGFVEALRESGTLDRSVLVFSADHGESFGEHDTWFCHQTVYEPDLHVPLVVRLPGGEGGGRRIRQGVQLVDLFPTLAELAGHPWAGAHGRSLVPLLEGGELPDVARFAEFPFLDSRALVLDGWKLVVERIAEGEGTITFLLTHPVVRAWVAEHHPEFAGEVFGTRGFEREAFNRAVLADLRAAEEVWAPRVQLFDLESDPLEQVDVSARHPERVAAMRELLEGELARGREERAAFPIELPTADPELLDRMRDLGYVDDEGD